MEGSKELLPDEGKSCYSRFALSKGQFQERRISMKLLAYRGDIGEQERLATGLFLF